MVTAHEGPSTGSIFFPPISVLKGTHTMLDAQHKTLTGEETFTSPYVHNTSGTALQLSQDQHTFLYLVVMSYSHTTWAMNCTTLPKHTLLSGKFLQIHRQDSNTTLILNTNPHLFHKNQWSVACPKPEQFWETELKNKGVFRNSLSAGSTSAFSCITQVLNKHHKPTSYRKYRTAQGH